MTTKRTRMLIIIAFIFSINFYSPLQSETINKVSLEEVTFMIMEELDEIPIEFDNLNALFSDQGEDNIQKYAEQFCNLANTLKKLVEIQAKWEDKIMENSNDKIYRVFAAAVQLAQATIYTKPPKYLTFFKL